MPDRTSDLRQLAVDRVQDHARLAAGKRPEVAAAVEQRGQRVEQSPSEAAEAIVARHETRCVVCGGQLRQPRAGRPRRTCSERCRAAAQRRRDRGLPEAAPRARTGGRAPLAARLGVSEDQVVVEDVEQQKVGGDA